MELEIRAQHQLSMRETLEFCLSSIRHRFFRSLLTLAVMALAVAFFTYLQTENLLRGNIRRELTGEIASFRKNSQLFTFLFSRYGEADFRRLLLQLSVHPENRMRLAGALKVSQGELDEFLDILKGMMTMEEFLSGVSRGKYAAMFGNGTPESFLLSHKPEDAAEILRKLRRFGLRPPVDAATLEKWLAGAAACQQKVQQFYRIWTELQRTMHRQTDGGNGDMDVRQTRYALLSWTEVEQEQFRNMLQNRGFSLDASDWTALREAAVVQTASERLSAYLMTPEIRQKWNAVFGPSRYLSQDEKFSIMDSAECREFRGPLTESEALKLAVFTRKKLEYNRMIQTMDLHPDSFLAPDNSFQTYLMVLAFLVCVIGITNAMLMSITERFTEIATLKCLGATDWFILVQIVLEAMLQGLCGGLLGIVLGMLAACGGCLMESGLRVFTQLDGMGMLAIAFFSLITGLAMATLSAIYPAAKAARMAPMEAMRVQ